MKNYLTILPLLIILLTSCRKNITVPNPELENLFGIWVMYQYSGGEGGNVFTPESEQKIEFSEKGICKTYKGGKKESKMKYTLTENGVQSGNMSTYTINYEKEGILLIKKLSDTQTILFQGKDTLILRDPCCDQYQYNYIKK